ncbi:uncharacterized protein LOC123509179 [Portunus trituberculatus]|uniref:uncharacterized protein LOC123509179 n=1 Tax=Portunus trituberculatus TaxID=210409 RepID=UPI001E1D085E|nr:uncharacterized protein LOC123509179 [Portunus trituberculatus]
MKGRLNYTHLPPLVHLLLLLHILTQKVEVSESTSVCIHHLGCYRDSFLHLHHVSTFHSLHTERNAENCVKLCLQKDLRSQIVLVKLVSVDDLLTCGCGGHEALGNRSGLTFDLSSCYLCPDSLREHCGSELTSSAYQINWFKGDPCHRVLVIPPAITTTATAATVTATPAATLKPPVNSLLTAPNHDSKAISGDSKGGDGVNISYLPNSVPNGSDYPNTSSDNSNYLPNKSSGPNSPKTHSNETNRHSDPNFTFLTGPNTSSDKSDYLPNKSSGPNSPKTHSNETNSDLNRNTTFLTAPNLHYIGCYDEENVNQSLVVTMVVESGGGGGGDGGDVLNFCDTNCTKTNPASEVLLVKVVSADSFYCGCGMSAALPTVPSKDIREATTTTSNQCVMRCGGGSTSVPCGGWMAVSVYGRNGQDSLSLSLSLSFLSFSLFVVNFLS